MSTPDTSSLTSRSQATQPVSNQNKTAEQQDNCDTFANNNNNNNNDSSALSDFRTEDIKTFNDTANSSQTLASSLNRVDLPMYECSNQEETPIKPNKGIGDDWDRSPQLGDDLLLYLFLCIVLVIGLWLNSHVPMTCIHMYTQSKSSKMRKWYI